MIHIYLCLLQSCSEQIMYRSGLVCINILMEAYCIYNIELYSAIKKHESIICRKIHTTNDDRVKQSKSDSEKYRVFFSQCVFYILYSYKNSFMCISWRNNTVSFVGSQEKAGWERKNMVKLHNTLIWKYLYESITIRMNIWK